MVAFNGPVLHQHRLTKGKAYRLGVAADSFCKQTTRAPVAVFILFLTVHRWRAEAPAKEVS